MHDLRTRIEIAESRIRPFIRTTHLEPAPGLSSRQASAFLKLECLQNTRSFKVRGALNKLRSLTDHEKAQGILTASTGNHGLAVAFGLQQLGLSGKIVLPETAAPKKIALLEQFDVSLQFYGQESAEAERFARKEAENTGQVFISPYNDLEVVAGQGTIGVELIKQLPSINHVFVPVGGGGLIGGIAGYLKAVKPEIRVVGCLPANSPVMHECIEAGKIVAGTVLPTLSDGTAGGVEENAVTFDICRQYVDDWIRVSEEEIAGAMKWLFEAQGLVVEGAAGVSVAAFQRESNRFSGNSVIILCGGNVDFEVFKKVVC